ncbi:MAG: N-acetylmuramoyl-L-alanine amidase [bacterium]
MNSKLKTILAAFLILTLLATTTTAETITVIDNINHSQTSVQGIVEDGIYFISISELAKAIQLSVWWDPVQKKVVIKDGEEILSLTVGQKEARSAKETHLVKPPPQLVEGRVFVPIDFVVTVLNSVFLMKADWYKTARMLSIKPAAVIPASEKLARKAAPSVESPPEPITTKPSLREPSPRGPSDIDLELELPSLGVIEDKEKETPLERIIIDPGHGGDDKGVKGNSGWLEKEAALDLAKELKSALSIQFPDLVVILTRETDVSFDLDKRINLANSKQADLFISLHLGASSSPKIGGFHTYYCSALPPEKRQYEVLAKSTKLAEIIQQVASERFEQPMNPPQPAPLYGLSDCFMPAVLVEIGYLTNPWDEMRLKNKVEQKRLVAVLLEAIARYKRIREIEWMSF